MTDSFSFVALGDMPYRPSDEQRFRRLIAATNGENPVFSIHLGDLKKGSQRCTADRYKTTLGLFNEFDHPLVYTPGDNDWADCHKGRAGKYDPLERLQTLRETFCTGNSSLGGVPMKLEKQRTIGGGNDTPENVRWLHGEVVFACLHITGQDNDKARNKQARAERRRRTAANIEWLEQTFDLARSGGIKALVVATHANLWFPDPQDLRKAFRSTLKALRSRASELGKPVLVMHGDKHTFIFDKPLRDTGNRLLKNVFRLQVPGDRDVRAVRVAVHPGENNPFGVSLISAY